MNDLYFYLVPFVAGLGIGLFFFGGLWLTLQQLPKAEHPALLIIASFLGRTALSLAAFYLAANGRWEKLLACILGFFLMRIFLVRLRKLERIKET